MIITIYLLLLTFFIILLNNYFLKKKILLSDSGDSHQKFSSKTTIPLTGGIFIFLSFLFIIYENLIEYDFLIFLFLIFVLGFFSDLKLIKSARKRLFYQLVVVLIYVFFNDVQISNTRIHLIDNFLRYEILNYFFVCFCALIIINGSNFIDGLNTLNIGYYLIICLVLIFLNINEKIDIDILEIKYLFFIILFSYLLNLNNKFFLGDSGSYLLGFIFSFYLIDLYDSNKHISPFFIVLLLWYPSFETLFSMIRKKILNRSSMRPDSNHLHQLVFFKFKKNYSGNIYWSNVISANIINFYNLLIFLISLNFINHTQIQIILIILNLIIYTVIYFRLFVYRYKKI